MKKILFTTFCCLMIIAAGTSCGSKNKGGEDGSQTTEKTNVKPAKEKYVKLAAKMNADMPQFFPAGIRMDRVEAVSEKEFRYVFTCTQEPAISEEEFVRSTRLSSSMGISQGKGELETLRKDKMTIIFSYYKMDGSLFAEIKVTPEEYSK